MAEKKSDNDKALQPGAEQAHKHFEIILKTRVRLLRFYISIFLATLGGFLFAANSLINGKMPNMKNLKEHSVLLAISIVAGLFLFGISWIFCKMEKSAKEEISSCLEFLEEGSNKKPFKWLYSNKKQIFHDQFLSIMKIGKAVGVLMLILPIICISRCFGS